MQPARPLREVFDELARGDLGTGPAGALADSGHGDLPDPLVSEAIVTYADTAPVEVAEHLAPFVKLHSAVPADDADGDADLAASRGLDLLATAPEQIVPDDPTDGLADEPVHGELAGEPAAADLSFGADPVAALDFGFGQGAGDQPADPELPTVEEDGGVAFEPSPAAEVPLPAESAAEPVLPWTPSPATDEAGEEAEDDAAG